MIKVKRLRTIFQKKNLKLKLTAGEILRDNIVEGATEVAYLAGNSSETVINVIDKATMLVGGGEAARALGNILVKTGQDVARGDTVCRGLGCISVTCEAVALCCSVLKFIPCRDTIYVSVKIVSIGCMSFRNACTASGNC